MYCRIFISALFVSCLLLGSCSTYEAKTSNDFAAGSKDDIFIDEAQADAVEGSAGAGEFPDLDEEASGRGPDDEDAFEGSAEGSADGAVVIRPSFDGGAGRSGGDRPVTPEPTRKPDPTKKTEPPLKRPSTIKPSYEDTPPPPSTRAPKPEVNRVPEAMPPKAAPPPPPRNELEPTSKSSPPGKTNEDDNETNNDIHIMGRKADERPTSFFSQPGILAAVIGGAVVGLLCAILLVMFIVYRMRKKDEGSYALEEPKRSPRSTSYQPPNKEFYA